MVTYPSIQATRITVGEVELEVVRVAAPCRLLNDPVELHE
jgi:hypothetical protein